MTNFKQIWKQLSNKKELTSYDMAAMCLSKALHQGNPELAKEYLNKAFKPITNQVKILNGAYPRYALWAALAYIEMSHLIEHLEADEKEKMKALALSLKGSFGEVNL